MGFGGTVHFGIAKLEQNGYKWYNNSVFDRVFPDCVGVEETYNPYSNLLNERTK